MVYRIPTKLKDALAYAWQLYNADRSKTGWLIFLDVLHVEIAPVSDFSESLRVDLDAIWQKIQTAEKDALDAIWDDLQSAIIQDLLAHGLSKIVERSSNSPAINASGRYIDNWKVKVDMVYKDDGTAIGDANHQTAARMENEKRERFRNYAYRN